MQWDISGTLSPGQSGFEDEQIQHWDSSATFGKETSQDLPQASPPLLGHVGAQLHTGQGRTVGLNPCLTETCSSSQAPHTMDKQSPPLPSQAPLADLEGVDGSQQGADRDGDNQPPAQAGMALVLFPVPIREGPGQCQLPVSQP